MKGKLIKFDFYIQRKMEGKDLGSKINWRPQFKNSMFALHFKNGGQKWRAKQMEGAFLSVFIWLSLILRKRYKIDSKKVICQKGC